jgi:hypothetical protein
LSTDHQSTKEALMKRLSAPALGVYLLVLLSGTESLVGQELRGAWEGELQTPARPIVVTFDFDQRLGSFGGGPSSTVTVDTTVPASLSVFEIGAGSRALKFIGTRTGDTLSGTATGSSGQSFRFWLAPLISTPAARDRTEAWQQDIDVVASRFLRYDHSFNDEQRTAARSRLERLRTAAASLTDAELLVELSRIVAMSRNAHTRLYFIRNRTEVSRLPVRVWWFGKELRIVRTSSNYQPLLGCRVTRIGALSVDEAFRRVRDIKAGNTSWQRYMSSYYLTSPDVLAGAHLITDAHGVALTVACGRGTRQVTVPALPVNRSATPVEAWWDLAPTYADSDATLSLFALGGSVPRYLRRARENYWFEYIPEDAVLYFQYNRAEPMVSKSMTTFITELTEEVQLRRPKAFVVDLRFNTGGDLNIATPLVNATAPLLKGTPIFVLTGRATFSAGLTHAAQWKHAGATLIGETVGDVLDFWSEGGNVTLPNSKLAVHYTNGFHKYSLREYSVRKPYYFELKVDSLAPDIPREVSWDAYIAGRDPLYAAVITRINARADSRN